MVCKLEKVEEFTNTDNSFILTMWYVNDNTVIDNVFKANGFILTMWYVNSNDIIDNVVKANMFYINYVVCKF